MNSELIINVTPREISFALLEDAHLVELRREPRDFAFQVGDIYLGRVKRVVPGNNAAFVDVGYKKEAFLHYYDLGFYFGAGNNLLELIAKQRKVPSPAKVKRGVKLPKEGKIEDYLSAGQQILVRIEKEPISTKGPRITADLSFSGRYMVLVPFEDKVSISSKITDRDERVRLETLVKSMKPEGFGVIVRTAAQGKRSSELDKEFRSLHAKWDESMKKALKAKPPTLLFQEESLALNFLRDTFNETFTNIVVNDASFADQIQSYLAQIAPGREEIVKLHHAEQSIFDAYGITRQIKSLFGRNVTYKSGAYLVIERTEAMYVVDVNSGNRAKKSDNQEETAFDVNMSAAEELVRQIRLRDMGGIIVVDFIDMKEPMHRQALYEQMATLMKSDRAQHNVLPLSQFGLMQITRKRIRPAVEITTEEACPSCGGTGKVGASLLFTDGIESALADLVSAHGLKPAALHLHPYVAAFVTKGGWLGKSLLAKWRRKYSKGLKIVEEQELPFLSYRFCDSAGNEIGTSESQ